MSELPPRILDIAHLILLDMLEDLIQTHGPTKVMEMLMRSALRTAEALPAVEFSSLEEFTGAIEELRNPIARIEGRAEHLGAGLFGLRRCPFADSIRSYTGARQVLPESFAAVTQEFNRPGPLMEQYGVGHGAGVSPFCAAHQPMRNALAHRISIGGAPVRIYQLGCRSTSGARGMADRFIAARGYTRGQIEAVLDEYMCCYAVVSGK